MKTLLSFAVFTLSLAVVTAADPPDAAPVSPVSPPADLASPASPATRASKSERQDRGSRGDLEGVVADAMKRAGEEVQKALEKAQAAGALSSETVREALAEAREELGRARLYVQSQVIPPIPPIPPVPAMPAMPAMPAEFGESGSHRSSRYSMHSGGSPNSNLILVGKPLEPKARTELEEDLDIMSHILEKKISREIGADSPDRALGILITGSGMENRDLEAMYVEGFGVVFSATVRMPLLPPAKPEDTKPKGATNSEWEQEKMELYGTHGKSGTTKRFHFDSMFDHAGAEYDAKKVEALEKSLIEALKNASHIRALEGDQFVSIAVTGGRASTTVAVAIVDTTGENNSLELPPSKTVVSPRPSTLHIRAKKSDIDAFASDKLSLEEFRKKVTVNVY
jgi:hypothetical protein